VGAHNPIKIAFSISWHPKYKYIENKILPKVEIIINHSGGGIFLVNLLSRVFIIRINIKELFY